MPHALFQQSKNKFSLKLVLIVPFITLTVLAAGLVGYFSFNSGKNAVNDVGFQLRSEIAKRIETHLNDYLNTPQQINQLNAVSIKEGILDASNSDVLAKHFWQQVRIFNSVTSVYFGNVQGGLVNSGREGATGSQYIIITDDFKKGPFRKFATDKKANRTDLLLKVSDFDARTRTWYKNAAEHGTGVWSPVYILFTGQDMAVAASRPVYDKKNKLLGVVSVDLFLSHISHFLQGLTIGKKGQSFIMERSGLLIASSTGEKLFTPKKEDVKQRRLNGTESRTPIIKFAAELLHQRYEDLNAINSALDYEFEIADKLHFLHVAPIENKYGLDWLIAVVVSEEDFMTQIEANRQVTILLIMATLVIVILIGIVTAQYIAKPIFRINFAALNLAEGKWQNEISDNSRIIEMSMLTRSFNKMATQLYDLLNSLNVEITERKQSVAALEEASMLYNKVISESPIGISIYNESGQCVEANTAIGNIIGATREQVLQQNYNQIETWEKAGLLRAAKAAVEVGQTKRLEIQTKSTFDKNVKTDCYFVPFQKKGKTNLLFMITDISERILAEEEKTRALEFAAEQNRHALIGQIAGKMAHDFNNILMGIIGNAQLATMEEIKTRTKEKLERIIEFARRGRDITSNLISFAKDQEPKQTYFKIEDKINLVLKMLEKELKGIKISHNYKPGIPDLLADPGMIQDVLTNIIQNAIHAMSKTENPTLILTAYSKADNIYIGVQDNGCGIPKEHQGSIFTPSFTLKGSHDKTKSYRSEIKGTGYGMSNVKKYVVEKHKGEISLESKVGYGTKITIILKVIKDHLSLEEKKMVHSNNVYKNKNILLVEDEPAIADVQYQILTKEPFHHMVTLAENGQMAIDMFDRNEFDVISLDYMLPGTLNGLDVYHYIRTKNQNIPIMFISGNIEFLESMKLLKEKDLKLVHISKPIDNLDYVKKINEIIGLVS